MAEAALMISSMIQQLDSHRDGPFLKRISDELRIVLAFLRDNKLGEESKLHYLIDDLDGIVHDLVCKYSTHHHDIELVQRWTVEVKRRLSESAVMRSENAGEESAGDEDVVVGLEKDVELLLRRVIHNEKQDIHIFIIKGMIGIGKTTLARQIYNHAATVDRFHRRLWVHVSTELSHKEVLMKLMQQLVDRDELERDSLMEKMERADNASLQQMLHQRLQGKPYFIVLDDFPSKMLLEPILKALPVHEDKRSRLMLTSRCASLRSTVYADWVGLYYVHRMETLSSNKSWKLFLKTILSGDEFTGKFPKHLEYKGRDVLKECGGVPLVIKEVGRQLRKKRQSGCGWEQLFESIDFGATLKLLESSYQRLDPELKSCFLHLAFFKKNTTMRKEKLEQIWIIGGMVVGNDFQIRSYVGKLFDESMIDIMDTTIDGIIRTCCINRILHRLCIKKAEDEIGFEILSKNGNKQPSQSPRRRVISCSREKFNYSTNQDKHLVSLFFHGGGHLDSSPSYWKSFELLEILDLEDFGLKILPESIGTLTKLKYLGLRNNYIKEIPDSLGCLKKVEVVDIALNFMVKVPDIIREMDSLRHLYMSDVICKKPLKIDALQYLKTLTTISLDNWTYDEILGLKMMTSLHKLGIEEVDGNSDVSKLFASIAQLSSLQCLILRGYRFRSMPCLDELRTLRGVTKLNLEGLIPKLPSAENFPPCIQYLKLVNSRLDKDPMPVLGKLRALMILKLRNAYTGQQMVIPEGSFPKLYWLRIREFWNLRNVQVGEGVIWELCQLDIKNCPYLESFPEVIGSAVSLQMLTMVTTKKIATKTRKSFLISKVQFVMKIIP